MALAQRKADRVQLQIESLGEGHETLEAILVAVIGLAMLFLVPLVWGALRKRHGLPMFGAPTVSEIEALGADGNRRGRRQPAAEQQQGL